MDMDEKEIRKTLTKVVKKVLKIKKIEENVEFDKMSNLESFDSLLLLELIAELESELKIRISDEELMKITTFNKAVEVISQLKKQ